MSADWLPRVPISCGAILTDEQDRLLILKPTYKAGWTIPGGIMEATGETPWEACRREVREETGLVVDRGRLVVMDTRGADDSRPLSVRFLFHCGVLSAEAIEQITLQASEISQHRFVSRAQAARLLRKRVARRVDVGWDAAACVYLEDGHRVDGVG